MNKQETKELAQKLEAAIGAIFGELLPKPGKKLMKEAKAAGKDLSKKLADIQKEMEKKATKEARKIKKGGKGGE